VFGWVDPPGREVHKVWRGDDMEVAAVGVLRCTLSTTTSPPAPGHLAQHNAVGLDGSPPTWQRSCVTAELKAWTTSGCCAP
jgi:hypothetical protein